MQEKWKRCTRLDPTLLLSGNAAQKWKKFKQIFKLYRIASGVCDRDAKLRVPLLLHVMGEESIERYNSFTWYDEDEEDKTDYNQVWKIRELSDAEEEHCARKISV